MQVTTRSILFKIGLILITSCIIYIDQSSKLFIINNFNPNTKLVVNSWLNLVYVKNPGIAFGLFANANHLITSILINIAIIISIGLVSYILTSSNHQYSILAAIALGGATGNIIDKITLGYVIDFIDLHWNQWHWPQFNIADSCIVLAALIYILINKSKDSCYIKQ